MRDIVWPRTDQGVIAQLVIVVLAVTVITFLVRRERSLVLVTVGAGLVLVGLMGVRGLH